MRKSIITLTLFLLSALTGLAQHKVSWVYGADFQYYFDNREYDGSENKFETSGTVHAARLTPSVGVEVSGGRMTHRLTLGIDMMRNMGESPVGEDDRCLQNTGLFREMTFWYGLEIRRGVRKFGLMTGMFPRLNSVFGSGYPQWSSDPLKEDLVPSLFISDVNRFYDNNMEGLLLKYETRRAYCEAGLDWMGQIGNGRRENFRIFTYGNFPLAGDLLRFGWTATMGHFANTLEYRGVVDNILVSPFVSLASGVRDFRWNAKLSYVQGVHQDRINETGLDPAFGGLLTLNLGFRKFGVLNESYYGNGQMPYFYTIDAGGNVLGRQDLYLGSPFYRIREEGESGRHPGFYDRAEVYWQPYLADFVRVRLSAVFHFTGDGFHGSQQKLSLLFDLERAKSGKMKGKNSESRRGQRGLEIYL